MINMEVREINFESYVLRENPLGDPYNRRILIIDTNSNKKEKPIIIYLSGYLSSSISLLNYNPFKRNILEILKKLKKENKISDLLFVLPDTFTKVGGNQYLDSPSVGMYESFIGKELIPFLIDNYNTNEIAIIGKSSGGFGALNLAMKGYKIRAIGVHSPDTYFEYSYLPLFPKVYKNLIKFKNVKKWLNYFWNKEEKSKLDFLTIMIIGLSAFYSPNDDGSFSLPFNIENGELLPDVWKKWLDKDPIRVIDKYYENLRKLKFFYLDVGYRDEFNLDIGTRLLHDKLKKFGVKHFFEIYNGSHYTNRLIISISAIYRELNST
jgi:hypothetical protein